MAYGVVTTFTDGRRSTVLFDNYFNAQVEQWSRMADWMADPSIADVRLVIVEGSIA